MYVYSFVHDDINSPEAAEQFIKDVKRTLPAFLAQVPTQVEYDKKGCIVIAEYVLSDMDTRRVSLTGIETAYPDVEISLYDDTRLLDVYPLEDRPYFYAYFLQAVGES